MDNVQMVIVVAHYDDPSAAESSRRLLAEAQVASYILPKVPGWLGRLMGRAPRYLLGVHEDWVPQAKALLR